MIKAIYHTCVNFHFSYKIIDIILKVAMSIILLKVKY